MSAAARLGAPLAIVATVIVFASAPGAAAVGPIAGVYDFEHLTAGAPLHGQDGWKVVGNNGGVTSIRIPDGVGRNTIIPGHDGSRAARQLEGGSNVNSRVVRRDDATWAITPVSPTGLTVIEFEMNHPYWGGIFALGVSNDDGTNITTGIRVLSRNEGTAKHRIGGPNGVILATHTTRIAQYGRYQLVLDAADGTASLAIKDLNPASTAGWVAPAILQNVQAGFNTDVSGSKPGLWNALLLHSESYDPTSLFDNIAFRTIEPTTRSLDFGATPLTTTTTSTLTIGGLYLAGRLTATLDGAGFSFDDDTTTRTGVATGELMVRFTPDVIGNATGTLTIVGEDMVRPLVIALDASGTQEPPEPPEPLFAAPEPPQPEQVVAVPEPLAPVIVQPTPPSAFVDCHGARPVATVELTCTVGGMGVPGSKVKWSAGYNPVFLTGTVVLDAQGYATVTIVPPAAAMGAMLWIELDAWATPVNVGIVEGVRPTRISAGHGLGGPAVGVRLLLLLVVLIPAALLMPRARLLPLLIGNGRRLVLLGIFDRAYTLRKLSTEDLTAQAELVLAEVCAVQRETAPDLRAQQLIQGMEK